MKLKKQHKNIESDGLRQLKEGLFGGKGGSYALPDK